MVWYNMHERGRNSVIFLRTTNSDIHLQAHEKTSLQHSLELTTKHLIRKQVKQMAVTDPT